MSSPIPTLPGADATAEVPLAVRRSRPSTSPQPRVPFPKDASAPKRILVLGATSGIAEASIRIWASRGDNLFLVGRNADRLNAVAADARTRGAGFVEVSVVDLDNTNAHPELLAHAINSLGGLDVAYVAVGMLGDQARAERNFADAGQILHTNFIAPASLLTWLANYCAQRHAGTLAVLSSVAGDRGRKSNYVYGSSKAGLSIFLDGLRNRIDREGVRVMTIKPGPVKTAMTEGMKGEARFADVNKVAATIVNAIGKGRRKGPDILYVPGLWRFIMAAVRAIPESQFKKMDL